MYGQEECPQCYCGGIRQMFTFFANLYCPKDFHRPNHSIRIAEYHMKKLSLNPTSSPGLEPRTVDLSSCNLAETNKFCLSAILTSCLFSEIQKTSSSGLEPRTVFRCHGLCSCNLLFEANNFGFDAILLSCLVSELQEPPSTGNELRTLFRSFDHHMFSFWSHGTNMPSLVQFDVPVLEI
jgi:hypothetical protein